MGFLVLLLCVIRVPSHQESVSLAHVFEKSKEVHDFVSLCGPVSLARILASKGERVEFSAFLAEFECRTTEGVPISELLAVSEKHGTSAQGVSFPDRQIDNVPTPAILIVDEGTHCLVLDACDPDTRIVRIWDPASLREIAMPEQVLMSKWGGDAILFEGVRPGIVRRAIWIALIVGIVACVYLFSRSVNGGAGGPAKLHGVNNVFRVPLL